MVGATTRSTGAVSPAVTLRLLPSGLAMSESIEFSSFVDWLEHQGEIDGPVVVSVTRSRFSGHHQDFAHGLVEARLDSPFGRLSIISGWSAFVQPRRADGWYVEHRPDAKGQGITPKHPVFNLVEAVQIRSTPGSEEL